MRRFLVDNQLPAALAVWLRSKGCSADHVFDLGLAQSSDDIIWRRAAAEGAVILTKDEDFAQMTVLLPESVVVVWLRVGNCRTAALLDSMERLWPRIVEQLDLGSRLVEVY